MVYPPKEHSELDDLELAANQVIDFDKLSVHRRSLMRNEWDREATKGESV